MSGLTDNLEVHVSAAALTDPHDARRLAAQFGVILAHERRKADDAVAERFVAALIDALHDYAGELERAHDEVIRRVTGRWLGTDD